MRTIRGRDDQSSSLALSALGPLRTWPEWSPTATKADVHGVVEPLICIKPVLPYTVAVLRSIPASAGAARPDRAAALGIPLTYRAFLPGDRHGADSYQSRCRCPRRRWCRQIVPHI